MNKGAFTCHFLVVVSYIFTTYYTFAYVDFQSFSDEEHTYGGQFQYLTIWNLWIQTGYFILAFLNDIFGSDLKITDDLKKRTILQRLRDYIFNSVVFPCGVFVVVLFWGIYSIDRELIYPADIDNYIPQWHNHMVHTTVLLYLLLEKAVVYHHFENKRLILLGTVCFAWIYLLWLLWIRYFAGYWVYTILAVMNWPQRLIFVAVTWTAFGIICIMGERLTNFIWGIQIAAKKLS